MALVFSLDLSLVSITLLSVVHCGWISSLGYNKVLMRSEGLPDGWVVRNAPANAGDGGSVSGSGRSPGEGNGNPFQCSCLGNPMNRGAWKATPHTESKKVTHYLATKQQQGWNSETSME